MESARIIRIPVERAGTAEQALRAFGVSSSLCTALRKRLGLVSLESERGPIAIRLTQRLERGQTIRVALPPDCPQPMPVYDLALDIAYQDEDLAIVVKPPHLASIAVHGHYGRALPNALAAVWGDFVYRPVHRLDRDTSGLIVIARNRFAHGALCASGLQREYLALCRGKTDERGIVEAPIGAHPDDLYLRAVRADGAPATTYYRRVAYRDGVSLVRLRLGSGRTHQIRLHMAHIGHPLCCDADYNPDPAPPKLPNGAVLDRQALHSARVALIHPVTKARLQRTHIPTFATDWLGGALPADLWEQEI